MRNFCIELDKPSHLYISGEMVQGRVIIETDKPKEVKEITLLMEGLGRVQWSLPETFTVNQIEIANGHTRNVPKKLRRLVAYSEKERYISQRITLAGDNYNPITLPEGTTMYPFQFVLPANCPSSFCAKFGHVSYLLEAELRRHVLKRNRKTTVTFMVNGRLDLNLEPGARQVQQMEKLKGRNLLSCRSGKVKFVLRLPKSGYVPGEILDFSSDIINNSNRKIIMVKASLHQVIQCHAKLITKTERRNICTVEGPQIDSRNLQVWKPDSIRIPPLPPTKLGGMCRIIDVEYYIRFEAKVAGLSKSLLGELPIIIGTTALNAEQQIMQQHNQYQ